MCRHPRFSDHSHLPTCDSICFWFPRSSHIFLPTSQTFFLMCNYLACWKISSEIFFECSHASWLKRMQHLLSFLKESFFRILFIKCHLTYVQLHYRNFTIRYLSKKHSQISRIHGQIRPGTLENNQLFSYSVISYVHFLLYVIYFFLYILQMEVKLNPQTCSPLAEPFTIRKIQPFMCLHQYCFLYIQLS